MNSPRFHAVASCFAIAACTQGSGCVRVTVDEPQAATVFSQSRVLLVDTELLEPPVVGGGDVFKPALQIPVESGDGTSQEAAGFFVTVTAADPESLKVRAFDQTTRAAAELIRVEPPANRSEHFDPSALPEHVREALRRGAGVFWPAGDVEADVIEAYRFAVLIPERLLSAFLRLEFYTTAADDGTPLGSMRIDLVRDFFFLANLGDSVQWGNGLREEDKISSLVGRAIEARTGRKVIRQRYAQSGATVVPHAEEAVCAVDCNGEVPTSRTSIRGQIERIEHPQVIDLVLMDGCITDVDIVTITDPSTTDEELVELTQRFCGEEMGLLLRGVRASMPQARIIVTGYYQFIGPESDEFALRLWSDLQDFDFDGDDEALLDEMTHQSVLFRDTAHESLRAAIASINAEDDAPPNVAFADPAFGADRAMFSPDRWLWSMTPESAVFRDFETELPLFPEDPIQYSRLSACFEPDVADALLSCLYVSVGHPNPAGARAFADAVLDQLDVLGVFDVPADSP